MMSAAPVMMRLVAFSPTATASTTPVGAVEVLAYPAEEEHVIVHAQAEEDAEQEQRHPGFDGRLLEAEQLMSYAHLEDEHQHAVRGADRQKIHEDGRERDYDRSKDQHQQDEGQTQHEGDHGRRERVHEMHGVAVEGGLPRDVHRGV